MKLFIAILSLMFGVMIGAGITTFLVVKKNQTVKNYLCKDAVISDAKGGEGLSILSPALIEKLTKDAKLDIDAKKAEELKLGNSDISEGPGGCKNEDACLEHCSKLENLQECIAFAKKYLSNSDVKK